MVVTYQLQLVLLSVCFGLHQVQNILKWCDVHIPQAALALPILVNDKAVMIASDLPAACLCAEAFRPTCVSAVSTQGARSTERWNNGRAVCTVTLPPADWPSSNPHTVQEGYLAACSSTVKYASSDKT